MLSHVQGTTCQRTLCLCWPAACWCVCRAGEWDRLNEAFQRMLGEVQAGRLVVEADVFNIAISAGGRAGADMSHTQFIFDTMLQLEVLPDRVRSRTFMLGQGS